MEARSASTLEMELCLFSTPALTGDSDHATRTVEAAMDMQRDFEEMKRGWSEAGILLPAIYNRLAAACGPVPSPIIGIRNPNR
jgi:hypothetical protein